MMEKECRFCNIINNNIDTYGVVDRPFLSNKDFFSLVSIGAFIFGWTLIIPKEHVYNLSQYYGNEEFRKYLHRHIELLRNRLQWNKKIILFEHGANSCNSLTACGTCHAHLHTVPFNGSILESIIKDKTWHLVECAKVAEFVQEKEYLLYCETSNLQENTEVYIHIIEKPESQYFRRILAEEIGLEGEYNYNLDARLEQSVEIMKLLGE